MNTKQQKIKRTGAAIMEIKQSDVVFLMNSIEFPYKNWHFIEKANHHEQQLDMDLKNQAINRSLKSVKCQHSMSSTRWVFFPFFSRHRFIGTNRFGIKPKHWRKKYILKYIFFLFCSYEDEEVHKQNEMFTRSFYLIFKFGAVKNKQNILNFFLSSSPYHYHNEIQRLNSTKKRKRKTNRKKNRLEGIN